MQNKNYKYYLHQVLKIIQSDNTKFCLLKIRKNYCHGYCIFFKMENSPIIIILDPRKEFISTLVHECLHGAYQTLSETKISKLERKIMENITKTEILNLLDTFNKKAKFTKFSKSFTKKS